MKRAVLAVLLLIAAPSAFADGRAFSKDDYIKYFSAGRFASKSDYYASTGVIEIVSNRTALFASKLFLIQTIEAIDVSSNYDLGSVFPYYKVKSKTVEQLVWDEARGQWLFEYTPEEFAGDTSLVWESVNRDGEISVGDRAGGDMHKFYNAADRRGGRDVKAIEAQYRRSVIGTWTWRCSWLEKSDYEVECVATHQPTHRAEDYSYRRMDQIS